MKRRNVHLWLIFPIEWFFSSFLYDFHAAFNDSPKIILGIEILLDLPPKVVSKLVTTWDENELQSLLPFIYAFNICFQLQLITRMIEVDAVTRVCHQPGSADRMCTMHWNLSQYDPSLCYHGWFVYPKEAYCPWPINRELGVGKSRLQSPSLAMIAENWPIGVKR